MRTKLLATLATVVAFGLGTLVRAGSDEPRTEKTVVHISSHDGKWKEMRGGIGVQQIVISGDPERGAHEAFTKFPAGADHGWHTHTSDVRIVVISGSYVFRDEHGKETRVKAGDYLYVPGGTKHWSGSTEGCVFYQTSPDKFDLVPVKK